ncbi:hypothetical protein ACQKWADRAFT_329594 [Trichoderma austrokoningii]
MNAAGDYSAAYCILETDSKHSGHGMTFTIGRGNDIVCAAILHVANRLKGKTLSSLVADWGKTWRYLVNDSQLRDRSSSARQTPSLQSAQSPVPPPPPPPTLSSAALHLSDIPRVALMESDSSSDVEREPLDPPSLLDYPVVWTPSGRRPIIAVLPHPTFRGFLPVEARPEVISYYLEQMSQSRFLPTEHYTWIDLPTLSADRVHYITCPYGIVPLRGDPELNPPHRLIPDDVDLEALDAFIDELDDLRAELLGPCLAHGRSGPKLIVPLLDVL